ncbi:MAG: EamA family transporter [Clostridia bacterium]|nr:EamA family transporter [Clostridia bacterium]
MEYVLLAGSCICFSLQFIFSKLFQRRTDGTVHAAMWSNLLSGISIFIIFWCINCFKITVSGGAAALAVLYAASSIICTWASLIGMSATTVAAITLYTLLGGVVLPFFYGVFALSERPSPFRWIGVTLMILAAFAPYVINNLSKKETAKAISRLKAAVCCAVVFFTNGLISIATNASERIPDHVGSNDFLLISTVLRIFGAAAILLALTLVKKDRNVLPLDPKTNGPVKSKAFVILFVISFFYAVLNGAGNIFSLNCAKTMDASLQFPIISAACIVFSAFIGLVAFKEKPGKGDVAGIVLAIAGIVFTIF